MFRYRDPLRIATVGSVSGNNCSITFDGVSYIKRIPIIGDPRLVAPGAKVTTQFINNRYVVLATGMASESGSFTLAAAATLLSSSGTTPGTTTPPPEVYEGGGGLTFGSVILFHENAATEYASLILALAAAASDDTVWIAPGTQVGNVTVPDYVTVVGVSQNDSIIAGTVTLGNGSVLENLLIMVASSASDASYGVVDAEVDLGDEPISAEMRDVKMIVENDSGPAYCVCLLHGGSISAHNVELLAEVGTPGYAVHATYGEFYHFGGRAMGTTALLPYWV